MREVLLYLSWYPTLADAGKIKIALGFMTEGSAVMWRDSYIENHLNVTPITHTWNEFFADANDAFSDKGEAERARTALDRLEQRGMRIDEYVTKFRTLCAECSLTSDSERIRLMKHHINRKIAESIAASGTVPDTFNAYRDRVLEVGRTLEQFQQEFHSTQPSTSSRPHHPVHRAPAQHVPQILRRPQAPPAPYGSRARPIEVDRTKLRQENRCFNCHKVGHFGRDCPDKRQQNVRALAWELTDEERMELLQTLQSGSEVEMNTEDNTAAAPTSTDEDYFVQDFTDDL